MSILWLDLSLLCYVAHVSKDRGIGIRITVRNTEDRENFFRENLNVKHFVDLEILYVDIEKVYNSRPMNVHIRNHLLIENI